MDAHRPTTFSALFKQISSPTTVTHSVFCYAVHPRHRSLVVVRGTALEIYDVKDNGTLSFITSASLCEEVEDIATVRFYGDQLDSILLSFKEAKVSAMNFDINTYELKTCSLHTYEQPSLKVRFFVLYPCVVLCHLIKLTLSWPFLGRKAAVCETRYAAC